MTEQEELIEGLRRIYRGLEMSAEIMRDARRTGGWAGAERTATAFARYAQEAKRMHTLAKSVSQ